METNSGLKVKLISRQRGFNFENLTILMERHESLAMLAWFAALGWGRRVTWNGEIIRLRLLAKKREIEI